MKIPLVPCASLALGLCLLLVLPAFPQSGGFGSIGPSKGQIIGGIAGGAAVLAVGFWAFSRAIRKESDYFRLARLFRNW